MNAAAPAWRPNRRRLWSNWLWLLALVLSVAALWSGVRVIHDNRLRRETLRLLAYDRAQEIAGVASERFQLLTTDAFSPIWNQRRNRAEQLAALEVYHAARARCQCADTLPVTAFFVFDASEAAPYNAASRRLDRSNAAGTVPDSILMRVVGQAWDQAVTDFRHPAIRLAVDSALAGFAVVTVSDPYSAAHGTDLYGAIMPVGSLATALFDKVRRGPSADTVMKTRVVISHLHIEMGADAHHGPQLVQLDSLSLAVAANGKTIFGRIGQQRQTASVQAPGALAPFLVTVGIRSTQASMAVLMPVAHDRLWMNGVLTLSTLLVVVFAIGSSRREVLLARARSDFLAGVSHDLRMPLAQILLASETLTLERVRDEKDRASLSASILREARRLRNMVDNVLLFSRTGAVGLHPQLHPVNVAEVFAQAIESVTLSAADAGQHVETEGDRRLEVIGDRELLRQAVVNLLDNAIKYGERGQTVRLAATRHSDRVRLSVEDAGPGIPSRDRERLFEPYERLGQDQTSERTGSGLGLAVVKQIVDACNGKVFVDDTTNGTRIVIDLAAVDA